ncbi:MAG: M14 family zinc carboxypeptidase [Gemmatimonadota bacterium]|nr:M14 family zinc carboxypeptidase [Gemmatimonadota bacterium]
MKRGVLSLLAALVVVASHGTVHAQQDCCRLIASEVALRYRVAALAERRFTHRQLWDALAPFLGRGGVRATEIGRSVQGRALRAISFGTGPTRVLLWSQMHGDESTATMALADIVRFLAEGGDAPLRRVIRERLTVVMIPMLNPDGAERFQRRNAVGVDINRDARRLATPEARALKALRDSLRPDFGFNLHDQGARNTVGENGLPVAIALLAPAADSARSFGPVRDRARQLAALLIAAAGDVIAGRVAKYDDTFNPRAFGDLIQQWGTSTILIESGALPDDPQKQHLRGINVMLVLTALEAIATERYTAVDIERYETVPFNRGVPSDVLLSGGQVVVPNGEPLRLDIALRYEDPVARRGLVVEEIGDLTGAQGMDTVDVRGLFLHVETTTTQDPDDWWLLPDQEITVTVRRGPGVESEMVARLPEPKQGS